MQARSTVASQYGPDSVMVDVHEYNSQIDTLKALVRENNMFNRSRGSAANNSQSTMPFAPSQVLGRSSTFLIRPNANMTARKKNSKSPYDIRESATVKGK